MQHERAERAEATEALGIHWHRQMQSGDTIWGNMQHATCSMQHATCNMQNATCKMQGSGLTSRRMGAAAGARRLRNPASANNRYYSQSESRPRVRFLFLNQAQLQMWHAKAQGGPAGHIAERGLLRGAGHVGGPEPSCPSAPTQPEIRRA